MRILREAARICSLIDAEAIDREKAEEVKRLRAALVEAEEFLRELNGYGLPMREAARVRVLNRVRAALEAKP